MSVAAALVLRPGDRSVLTSLVRSSAVQTVGAASADRVAGGGGLPNAEIARRVGVTRPRVISWRARYETGGLVALEDLALSGRSLVHDEVAVVVATLSARPRCWG